MRPRSFLFFAIVGSLAAVVGLVWLRVASHEPGADASVSQPPSRALADAASHDGAMPPVVAESAITLPVYVADVGGLPPIDQRLRDSVGALRSAADGGNATAACRLAFTAMSCWTLPRSGAAAGSTQTAPEYSGNDEITVLAIRRINEAPPALREHVRERIEAIELARATEADAARARARRCEDAPQLDVGEVAGLLRQAALAGQPDAVAAYATGQWMDIAVGLNAARTPWTASPPWEILRAPAFRDWRRDAAAVHAAGLEAGLLTSIEAEAQFNRMGAFDLLVQRDPIQQAAALRALALLVGSGTPPSTATLGLEPDQALDADRRSERWAAAARARSPEAHESRGTTRLLPIPGEVPACE